MKNNILFISPHPDDETLGCSGVIQRHFREKDNIYWLNVTSMNINDSTLLQIKKRDKEIKKIKSIYQFKETFQLNFITGKLDQVGLDDLVKDIGNIIKRMKINVVYTPFINDVHTDHKYVSKAVIACTKWFRNSSIRKILMYETVSETNFNFLNDKSFKPNLYMDISIFLEKKIKIAKVYNSEIKTHPFPRSAESIRSLAILRGSESGFKYAEAFMLVYERL